MCWVSNSADRQTNKQTPTALSPCCIEVTDSYKSITVSYHKKHNAGNHSDLINIGTCLRRCFHVRNAPLASSTLCDIDWYLTSLFQVHLVADEQEWNPLITLHTKYLLSATTHSCNEVSAPCNNTLRQWNQPPLTLLLLYMMSEYTCMSPSQSYHNHSRFTALFPGRCG